MKARDGGCVMSANSAGLQTLSQKRAKHAWNVVERLQKNDIETFASEAKKFPLRIRNAGLLQCIAFMMAKSKGLSVLNEVQDWLKVSGLVVGVELRALLLESDSQLLRLVTQEAIAYLEWLVRFSEARKKEIEANAKSFAG